MRSYNLNIAGYRIRFEAAQNGPELVPSEKFLRNISHENVCDVKIRIHEGVYGFPSGTERVFHAPYVEEINGKLVQSKSNFWSIWKSNTDMFIRTIFPRSSSEKNAVMRFSLGENEWDMWIETTEKEIDPFDYPLDGLILYYLTVIYRNIMIHASGINISGNGYLFSGVSGKGKSTLARLWEDSGARVIHDDRLIIRRTAGDYRMFNTPVYNNDEPRDSVLNRIYIIDHGVENKVIPVRGATAISLVIANCIQHNWSHSIIERLLDSVSDLCNTIPVYRLFFKPDRSIIDLILKNE
jgi:hypothetical protein